MVFAKRNRSEDKSYNIGVTMGCRTIHKGVVGLEIEVEGKKFPKPPGMQGTHTSVAMPGLPGWSYVHDGSLRGEDNAEYVLTAPVEFSEIPGKVDELWALLDKNKSVIAESNRTSVHVHLNVQSFHLNRLASIIGIYFALEEILAEFCGEYRVGNLFCLRAKDAPAVVSQVRRFIRSNMESRLRDGDHYAGLNTYAIAKFGSLEFRTMRGVNTPPAIKTWVSILERIYNASAEFTDPRAICEILSQSGPMQFFELILGDLAEVVRRGVSMSEDQIRDSLYEGIRIAQDVCYARDWDVFKPMEYRPDPFDRPANKKRAFGMDHPIPVPDTSWATANEILNVPDFDDFED